MKQIIINFETPEQAQAFMTWMSESGEQSYWEWIEDAEDWENRMDLFSYNFDDNVIRATKNVGEGDIFSDDEDSDDEGW